MLGRTPHQGGSPLRCFVDSRSRAPPPAHERACESGAVVEEGPVRMTQRHERSTERPLNGAMPKQPRVSLPNLDSLALSPLAGCMRERILSQVLKSAPLAVQLQHAHRTAPFYQLRTVIWTARGNPQSSWRGANSRPRPSSKPKLKQTVTPGARNGIPSHMALRSSTAWASSWLVEIPKGRPGPSREVGSSVVRLPSASYQIVPRPGGREG